MQRLRFMGRVIVSGLRWVKGVVEQVHLLVGVVALTVGVTWSGLALHRPASFLGVFAGVALLVILGEGAYRVWREADTRAAALPGRRTDATAVWLSEQLSKGNALLLRWGPHVSRDIEKEAYKDAATWEQETQDGLATRVPMLSGHFGVDVGLGPEFATFSGEAVERARLRRRIHRLAEIVERYGKERSQ